MAVLNNVIFRFAAVTRTSDPTQSSNKYIPPAKRKGGTPVNKSVSRSTPPPNIVTPNQVVQNQITSPVVQPVQMVATPPNIVPVQVQQMIANQVPVQVQGPPPKSTPPQQPQVYQQQTPHPYVSPNLNRTPPIIQNSTPPQQSQQVNKNFINFLLIATFVCYFMIFFFRYMFRMLVL